MLFCPAGFQGQRHPGTSQARTDTEYQVDLRPQAPRGGNVHTQFMGIADHATSTAKSDDRRIQQFGQLKNRLRCALCTAAHENHGEATDGEQARGNSGDVGIGRRRQRTCIGRNRRHRRALGEDIPGHFQDGRTGPALPHLFERFGHQLRRLGRMFDPRHPLAESRRGAELIGHFMQMAAAPVQKGSRHLPRQAQYRLIAAPGREQSGARIQQARPGYHRAYRRPTRRAGIPESHVAAGLLMTRTHSTHARLRAVERIKQPVGLGAGQPEDGVDAMRKQRINQRLTTGTVAGVHRGQSQYIHIARTTPNRAPASRTATEANDSSAPNSRFSGARM